jgi:hypothetical protein
MYCSSCGAASAQGLSYCNRCGANLSLSESLVSTDKPKGLGFVISLGLMMTTGVALGGLALALVFALEFFKKGFPIEAVTILAVLSLVMLFGTTALLSRQLSRLISVYLESGASAMRPKKAKLSEAAAPLTAIDAPREPALSVTEHTTRTFDPKYLERKT